MSAPSDSGDEGERRKLAWYVLLPMWAMLGIFISMSVRAADGLPRRTALVAGLGVGLTIGLFRMLWAVHRVRNEKPK